MLKLGPRWFDGARLNFAENLLRHCSAPEAAEREALVFWNEAGRQRSLSYAQLWEAVRCAAGALRGAGRGRGRPRGGLPAQHPRGRHRHARRGQPRRGVVQLLAGLRRRRACSTASARSRRACSSRRRLPLQRHSASTRSSRAREHRGASCPASSTSSSCRTSRSAATCCAACAARCTWDAVPRAAAASASLSFERLPFDHPLYIMYSSGTTGLPKCMVHGAGGTLLQHLKELRAAQRRPARRPRLLLHHLRLDDVELARQRPWPRAPRSCSTTARRWPPTAPPLGHGRSRSG